MLPVGYWDGQEGMKKKITEKQLGVCQFVTKQRKLRSKGEHERLKLLLDDSWEGNYFMQE